MVKVSIVCLIYKSTKLADWVYESLYKYTPMLKRGEAEFFFVANDPTDAVIKHLMDKNYPFVVNNNEVFSNEELFKQGYGMPEYMNRVYKGYNQGILHAKGEKIVLINSDNYFSVDWLENLLKYSTFKNIVCSQIVEPGHEKYSFFPTALRANFGKTTDSFDDEEFQKFVLRNKKFGLKEGGAYMPCLLWKEPAIYAGLYPEGNIAGDNFETVVRYGDECFYDKLKEYGLEHVTSQDSIVYHLKEGEIDDVENSSEINLDKELYKEHIVEPYKKTENVQKKDLLVELIPSCQYKTIFETISEKKCLALCPISIEKKGIFKKIKTPNKTKYRIAKITVWKKVHNERYNKYYLLGVQIYSKKRKED